VSVKHLILIDQTIDSTMCNTTSILDDASAPTNVPEMIETTVAASIVVKEEDEEQEDQEDEDEESLEGVGRLIQDPLSF
jgi:hypothetical protein